MALKQQKAEKLYFSIGEVAQQFGLNESTLRFWEKEFDEISPRKTKKGTRYYRQEDIEQIRLIHHLVKERGMTRRKIPVPFYTASGQKNIVFLLLAVPQAVGVDLPDPGVFPALLLSRD